MLILPEDTNVPELDGLIPVSIEGTGLDIDCRLYWREDMHDEDVERFVQALDFFRY